MSDLLDLSIDLTLPPDGSPPGILARITLRCDALGLSPAEGHLGEVMTPAERAELLWYLEESPLCTDEEASARARAVEDLLVEIGRRLYRATRGGEAAEIVGAWRLQPAGRRQVSLRSEVPSLLGLPWELLHDEQGFLALRTRSPVAVLRRLPRSELPALQLEFARPLRILLVTARPDAAPFIDHRLVAGPLVEGLIGPGAGAGEIALEFLRPPTLPSLHQRLGDPAQPPVHVLHFDGHGLDEADDSIAELSPEGQPSGLRRQGLAFEDAGGRLDLVPPHVLAQVLQGSEVRVAVLTACRSALSAGADPFSSIAAQLIRSGLDAVVGMGANLLADSAQRFAESFYRAVAAGVAVPEALGRVRQAMHDAPGRPADRVGGPIPALRDWWVPQLFQQRPLEFQASRSPGGPKRTGRSRAATGVPAPRLFECRYGFAGRARELLRIERALVRGRIAVVHGPIGSGRTALAGEAADWLTRTGPFSAAGVVALAASRDAPAVHQELGGMLGLTGKSFDPSDPASILAVLRKKPPARPVLVVADDLDAILPGGATALDPAPRAALVDLLLALPELGCGVVITSRSESLGDARLAPSRRAVHLALGGLEPRDAAALAGRILADLEIDRRALPPRDLDALLGRLERLPLAMELILPTLRRWHPVRLQGELRQALDQVGARPIPGLPNAIAAAWAVWRRALADPQRVGLDRLNPDPARGDLDEDAIRGLTGLSEVDWGTLRLALATSGLVSTGPNRPAGRPPSLSFHAALGLLLARRPSTSEIDRASQQPET
jgi:hypothetical protein